MGAAVNGLARGMAYLGGLVLVALVVTTCISIAGREGADLGYSGWLGPLSRPLQSLGAIRGDYELVEMGMGFAIMAFWPWCQLNRAHASVGILTERLPRLERVLLLVWEIAFALVIALIAWRLYEGMLDKQRYSETTFLLQWPVWWGYAACFAASVAALVVACWCVWTRLLDLRGAKRGMQPS